MKKYLVFILIFFLAFSLHLKQTNASATTCHIYIDGVCQSWYYFDSRDYVTEETVETTTETVQQVQPLGQEIMSQFISLVFQFFGIVILFFILIVLLESVIESG